MRCEEVREAGPAWRAGKLAADAAARVEEHVDGCAACQQAVEGFGALFEALPVPGVDVAAAVAKKLGEGRAAPVAKRAPARSGVTALPPPPPAAAWRAWIAPAFAVAMAGALVVVAAGGRSAATVDGRTGVWQGAGVSLAVAGKLAAPADTDVVLRTFGNLELKLSGGTHVSRTAKGVELEDGQVGLAIAPGSRPGFTVNASAVTVTVSGTRFTVAKVAGAVRVALVDGGTHVTVPGAPERRMVPGQVITVAPDGGVTVAFMKADERARTSGWVGGAPRSE